MQLESCSKIHLEQIVSRVQCPNLKSKHKQIFTWPFCLPYFIFSGPYNGFEEIMKSNYNFCTSPWYACQIQVFFLICSLKSSLMSKKVQNHSHGTSKWVWYYIVDLFIICLINKSRQYDAIIISHQVCEHAFLEKRNSFSKMLK